MGFGTAAGRAERRAGRPRMRVVRMKGTILSGRNKRSVVRFIYLE